MAQPRARAPGLGGPGGATMPLGHTGLRSGPVYTTGLYWVYYFAQPPVLAGSAGQCFY